MPDTGFLQWPGWRSLLFVPILNQAMVKKAAARGADALVLDLEDAVVDAQKAAARKAVPGVLSLLADQGATALVRVNGNVLDMLRDLETSVRPGLAAVIVPKADRPDRLALVDELLTELEEAAGLPARQIGVIAMIETARGLLAAPELARASPPVMALAFGPEDLALDLGNTTDSALLRQPAARVVWSAKASGRTAVGFPGSISNFSDETRLASDLSAARDLGFAAALCIHPRQLGFCHQAFSVTRTEAEHARRVVDAFNEAAGTGKGVCALDGRMIDRPVVLRAQATLERWRQQGNDA